MEIPEVSSGINSISIRSREINISEIRPWEIRSPVVNRIGLDPVTKKIGLPIVNLPGCVEARQSDNMQLLEDDPNGNLTLCDGSIPYFRPIQFNPEVILKTPKPKANTNRKESAPPIPDKVKELMMKSPNHPEVEEIDGSDEIIGVRFEAENYPPGFEEDED